MAAAGGRIIELPDALINQIAAGEVVERPASTVKELAENALDAGATQVFVSVHNGGKDRIAVVDNGCGMNHQDALLATRRHATSKLRNAAGLAAIQTLGFRGEALASIAAVAKFELLTCAEADEGGHRIVIEGGRTVSAGRVGFPRGTKVTVSELFYNTPARRKFLRSTTTEFQHIQTLLTQLALAHAGVHFRLSHNDKPVLNLISCGTLAERTAQVLGTEMAESMVLAEGMEPTLRFEALLCLPSASKGSRRWQYLFINNRPVRDASLNHAVYHAYRSLLMKGRHPAFVLKLFLEPQEVDVNVHPAKTEVRLRNPQAAHAVLSDTLHRVLLDAGRRRAFGADNGGAAWPGGASRESAWREADRVRQPSMAAAAQLGMPLAPPPLPPGQGSAGEGRAAPDMHSAAMHGPGAPGGEGSLGAEGMGGGAPPGAASWDGSGSPPGVASTNTAPTDAAPHSASLRQNPYSDSDFHFQPLSGRMGSTPQVAGESERAGLHLLAQFQNTYLLAQRGQALLLVDQHAAHERILFEQYRTELYERRLRTAPYLLPETLELSPQNAVLLEQYLPQWMRLGFEIEAFGRDTYLVRQVPALLAGRDIKPLLLEVLDELALFGKSGRIEEVLNGILERTACHSAIRGGDVLSREEMESLLAQLQHLDVNLYCPHGRPVWVELPLSELERRFKRTV